jgi:uncharacterized protein YggE
MRRYVILFAAPVMAIALAACETETPRTVTVTATGTAQAEATHFHLSVSLVARADTREEAARAGEALSASIREALPGLEGLTSLNFHTSGFELHAICADGPVGHHGRNPAQCEPVRYAASQTLSVTGAPAEQGANAASLVNQLGALTARLDGYSNSENAAMRDEAMLNAAQEARARAERIADSLGVGLGPVISATPYGYGRVEHRMYDDDTITVTGERRQPDVPMSVEPGPVTVREELTFVFQLVGAPAAPDE